MPPELPQDRSMPSSRGRAYLRAIGALTTAVVAMNVAGALRHSTTPADAAPVGSVTVVKGAAPGAGAPLTGGGTATVFALQPPAGAACTGDGTLGYRVQSFIVSSDVVVDTMAWDSNGPAPANLGGPVRTSLYSAGNPVVELNPGLTSGALVQIPPFDFSGDGLNAAAFPNGRYTMGLACTRDVATGKVLDKYWSVQIDIVANASDLPNGFTWLLGGTTPTTTTTSLPPTTLPPTTVAPTTLPPTTLAPTTTVAPTTLPPTTLAPTTTLPPTTLPPTTVAPTTTVPPATVPPTTVPTSSTVPTSTTVEEDDKDDKECRAKDRRKDDGKGKGRGKGRGRCGDDVRFDDDHHRSRPMSRFVAV